MNWANAFHPFFSIHSIFYKKRIFFPALWTLEEIGEPFIEHPYTDKCQDVKASSEDCLGMISSSKYSNSFLILLCNKGENYSREYCTVNPGAMNT